MFLSAAHIKHQNIKSVNVIFIFCIEMAFVQSILAMVDVYLHITNTNIIKTPNP